MKRKQLLGDIVLFIAVFALAIALSTLLSKLFDDNNQFSIPLFILVVALISRYTHGYVFGILASVLSVICVNYIFTYPYWAFNLSITGYPLTFAVMLFVSITICTLTTQIKKREQLRFEMEREKLRANLLRSVSHDIRTPLASIVGASSVLIENPDTPERTELLEAMRRDADWLVRMTENVLTVTKVDGGTLPNREFEIVEELIGSAIVKYRKNPHSLPVTVSHPDEILTVLADATLIEQVLLNLLDNVSAHAEGASEIRITTEKVDKFVSISIADDGCGISSAALSHLFDGLAEMSSGDNKRNMGIGLSVCSAIVRAHGGKISARNDGGAVFTFTIPAAEEVPENG